MPEEQWTEIRNTVEEAASKIIPKQKKSSKAKWLSEEDLQVAKERRDVKSKGERERYIQLNTDYQIIAQRDNKAFFNKQCIKLEENNRGKRLDISSGKLEISREFCLKMDTIKDLNAKDLVDAEEIKQRWKERREKPYKKDLDELDDYDRVVSQPEPDLQETEVKYRC